MFTAKIATVSPQLLTKYVLIGRNKSRINYTTGGRNFILRPDNWQKEFIHFNLTNNESSCHESLQDYFITTQYAECTMIILTNVVLSIALLSSHQLRRKISTKLFLTLALSHIFLAATYVSGLSDQSNVLQHTFLLQTFLVLFAISIDRWLAISYPLNYSNPQAANPYNCARDYCCSYWGFLHKHEGNRNYISSVVDPYGGHDWCIVNCAHSNKRFHI